MIANPWVRRGGWAGGVLLLMAVPLLVTGAFPRLVATNIVAFVLYASALNIVSGMTGQLSIGHGAFVMIGAYSSALAAVRFELPFVAGIAIGIAVSVALSVLIGYVCLRLSGLYLAMITVAVSLVLSQVAIQAGFLGGADGMRGTPPLVGDRAWRPLVDYWSIAGGALLTLWVSRRLMRSHIGRSFFAVRDNALLAASSGVDIARARVTAFVLSGALASLGGSLHVHWQGFVGPEQFGVFFSLLLLLMMFLGGPGSFWGPVAGAVVLAALPSVVPRSWQLIVPIITGGLLLVAATFLPRGVVGLVRRHGNLTIDPATLPDVREQIDAPVAGASDTGADGPPVLEVAGVTKDFGGLRAVNEVVLAVDRGTIHCLIGPNGSGKTTLINLISGTLRVDEGEVRVLGERIDGLRSDRVVRAGVARTFQTGRTVEELSVLENVLLGAHVRHAAGLASTLAAAPGSRREARRLQQEALEMLAWVGLADVRAMEAGSLPAGHQRLLELARALMQRPRLLLLDEPAAGLNPSEIAELSSRLDELRGVGLSILLVEHHLRVVMELADQITVLDHGKVIGRGLPDEVSRAPAVIEAYLGRAYVDNA